MNLAKTFLMTAICAYVVVMTTLYLMSIIKEIPSIFTKFRHQ